MNGKTFLDTNVIVYAYDSEAKAKQARALAALAEEDRANLVVSTQVLEEVYVNLTRKLARPLSPAEAEHQIRGLTSLTVVLLKTELVLDAIALSRARTISLWDALIVKAAIVGGCRRVLTEDLQHGAEIEGVRIENPFVGL